ncbi:MAG: transcriptional repressor LexA [Acidimicrobiia bacterium]|nr:transcriptional repressor LexA [Acidimicrobiia bacterium]
MGTDISNRQQEILDYIRDTVADRGYPPSVREIGEAVGLSSPSTVHSHLSTLEATGHLRRDPTKPRAIEVLGEGSHAANVRNVPLVGRIAAGSPILAEEDIEDVYPLPLELVGDGPIFMLKVKGESMIEAGILDGDFVVIHRQPDALDGEIVAALIDGEEATVKRLERKNGAVILHSENPAFEPMVFTEGVELIGKVVTVLRGIG